VVIFVQNRTDSICEGLERIEEAIEQLGTFVAFLIKREETIAKPVIDVKVIYHHEVLIYKLYISNLRIADKQKSWYQAMR